MSWDMPSHSNSTLNLCQSLTHQKLLSSIYTELFTYHKTYKNPHSVKEEKNNLKYMFMYMRFRNNSVPKLNTMQKCHKSHICKLTPRRIHKNLVKFNEFTCNIINYKIYLYSNHLEYILLQKQSTIKCSFKQLIKDNFTE